MLVCGSLFCQRLYSTVQSRVGQYRSPMNIRPSKRRTGWGRSSLLKFVDVLELVGRLVSKEVSELVQDAARDESNHEHGD